MPQRGEDSVMLPENSWKRNTAGHQWRGSSQRRWNELFRPRETRLVMRLHLLRDAEKPSSLDFCAVHLLLSPDQNLLNPDQGRGSYVRCQAFLWPCGRLPGISSPADRPHAFALRWT